MTSKDIYNILLKKEISDDIAAYSLYSNDYEIFDDVILALLNGYDFSNNKWVNDNDRNHCINHCKNFFGNDKKGRAGHHNILVLKGLESDYPADF